MLQVMTRAQLHGSKAVSAGSPRILIVDDSAVIRKQLRECLLDAGYQVVEAENGIQGLAAAKANAVEMFIVDVHMPKMNGLVMLSALRNLDGHKDTPALILSTEASPTYISRARTAGANAWIVKPPDPATLLEAVRRLLERKVAVAAHAS